jgi:hypothetical protein
VVPRPDLEPGRPRRTDQIEADARVVAVLSEWVPVLSFVNSHFEGYAPETLPRMAAALGRGETFPARQSRFGD